MSGTKSAIALGSNLGDSLSILENSLTEIAKIPGIRLLKHSRWYRTKAIGPIQPDYLNGCALLEVELSAETLLEQLLAIEKKAGRVRREKWGPRTLDLDLLLYGDLVLNLANLQIPHPEMHQRAFVLVPLAEIAPDWIHPVSRLAIANLVQQVNCTDICPLIMNPQNY